MEFNRALARLILEDAAHYDWTLQGFGMLRLYLGEDRVFRLHVWDSRFAVPGVSVMHDHPWGFKSYVVAGHIGNSRFTSHPYDGALYMCQKIMCGEGGGLQGKPIARRMKVHPQEVYLTGETYTQEAYEVHVSAPQDGTVTVVKRMFGADPNHARVFWPVGQKWVSAEPRRATCTEVHQICSRALETWF